MEFRQFTEKDVKVIALNGRLDQLSAPEVEHAFTKLLATGSARVLLDMSQVEYISSGGLRVLLMLMKTIKRLQGELRLCGLNPFVREVFELSNLVSLFDIHPMRMEALEAFGVTTTEPSGFQQDDRREHPL